MMTNHPGARWGEFHCPVPYCGHHWTSVLAYANLGQKCEKCMRRWINRGQGDLDDYPTQEVMVDKQSLEPLFVYDCQSCENIWLWKHIKAGIECKENGCKGRGTKVKGIDEVEYLKPMKLGDEETIFSILGGMKGLRIQGRHMREYCERCQYFGDLCAKFPQISLMEISWEQLRTIQMKLPFQSSIRSTMEPKKMSWEEMRVTQMGPK